MNNRRKRTNLIASLQTEQSKSSRRNLFPRVARDIVSPVAAEATAARDGETGGPLLCHVNAGFTTPPSIEPELLPSAYHAIGCIPHCVELSSGRPAYHIYHWLILAIHALPKDEAQAKRTAMEPGSLSATSASFPMQSYPTPSKAILFRYLPAFVVIVVTLSWRIRQPGTTPVSTNVVPLREFFTLDGSRASSHLPASVLRMATGIYVPNF